MKTLPSAITDVITDRWHAQFRQRLLAWYSSHHRDLPWRVTRDPYEIWVSETMLQQTQVATVIAYYDRFLKRFPTVLELAEADEQEVLRLWAGLGYYRRAKQLHAAARMIAQEHGGRMPTTADELSQLPGIGRYTAGAIASFAFDERAPILEANTQRLYSRLIGLRENPRTQDSQGRLWDFANAILPKRAGAGRVNQAVMELGSIVCKPRDPDCTRCPVVGLCPTAAHGLQQEIPLAPPKKVFTNLHHVAAIIQRDSPIGQRQLFMRCNPPGNWWEGLWDVPRIDLTSSHPARADELTKRIQFSSLIERRMLEEFNLTVSVGEHALRIHHAVTRYRIRLDCFHAIAMTSSDDKDSTDQFKWIAFSDLGQLAMSSTTKKIVAFLARAPRGSSIG